MAERAAYTYTDLSRVTRVFALFLRVVRIGWC